MITFWNCYVLKLLRWETITFSDATLSDINVVLCYVLSQYPKGANADNASTWYYRKKGKNKRLGREALCTVIATLADAGMERESVPLIFWQFCSNEENKGRPLLEKLSVENFQKVFPRARVLNVYGMTELGAISSSRSLVHIGAPTTDDIQLRILGRWQDQNN